MATSSPPRSASNASRWVAVETLDAPRGKGVHESIVEPCRKIDMLSRACGQHAAHRHRVSDTRLGQETFECLERRQRLVESHAHLYKSTMRSVLAQSVAVAVHV